MRGTRVRCYDSVGERANREPTRRVRRRSWRRPAAAAEQRIRRRRLGGPRRAGKYRYGAGEILREERRRRRAHHHRLHLKTLTDGERRAIYQALKDQPAGSVFNADIGTKLPPGIELRPVPDQLAARVPQTRDYRYAAAMDRVLLVGTGRIVAGVFADAPVTQEPLIPS